MRLFLSTAALSEEHMTLEDVCFVHLYVQDMRQFAQINAEYCRYFGQHMPPSRSCVEVSAIPARVLMDCVGVRGSGESKLLASRVVRDVLHIKSISAWAPNCIGPYSQANILHKSLILLAGQVAFQPQTMEIIGATHAAQAQLCYRNAGRVLEALDSNLRHACSAVVYTTELSGSELASLAELCRAQMVTNAGLRDVFEDVVDSDESDDEVDKDEERVKLAKQAPMLVVQVSHLPRDALVEVELQAFCHRVMKHLNPTSSASKQTHSAWVYDTQRSIIQRALCLVMCTATSTSPITRLDTHEAREVAAGVLACVEKSFSLAQLPWDRAVHFRVFYRTTAFASELAIASGTFLHVSHPLVSWLLIDRFACHPRCSSPRGVRDELQAERRRHGAASNDVHPDRRDPERREPRGSSDGARPGQVRDGVVAPQANLSDRPARSRRPSNCTRSSWSSAVLCASVIVCLSGSVVVLHSTRVGT